MPRLPVGQSAALDAVLRRRLSGAPAILFCHFQFTKQMRKELVNHVRSKADASTGRWECTVCGVASASQRMADSGKGVCPELRHSIVDFTREEGPATSQSQLVAIALDETLPGHLLDRAKAEIRAELTRLNESQSASGNLPPTRVLLLSFSRCVRVHNLEPSQFPTSYALPGRSDPVDTSYLREMVTNASISVGNRDGDAISRALVGIRQASPSSRWSRCTEAALEACLAACESVDGDGMRVVLIVGGPQDTVSRYLV